MPRDSRADSRSVAHNRYRRRNDSLDRDERDQAWKRSRDSRSPRRSRSPHRHNKSTSRRDESFSPPSSSTAHGKSRIDKDSETPEEKRARRLAKKLAEAQKQREQAGNMEGEDDNPFGDPQLHQVFVWKKKLKKEGLTELPEDEMKRRTKSKQEESRAELEKVRQRRLQYERERAAREEETQMMQREKEAAQFKQWEEQEDVFHLKQAQLRSDIRIRDGRAKAVDLLAKYISTQSEDLSVDIHEPYTYVEGLGKRDLEDLLEDIAVYEKLEQGQNVQYWKDITVIVNDELSKILRSEAKQEGRAGRQGISESVYTEVAGIVKGKTLPQLVVLEEQVGSKIAERTEGLDISFWEVLLQQVGAQIARTRLRDKHQENLKRKLEELKREQGIRNEERRLMPPPSGEGTSTIAEKNDDDDDRIVESAEDHQRVLDYNAGQYSPRLISFDDMDVDFHLVEPEDDERKLRLARDQVQKTGSAAIVTTEDHVFEREARKGMGDDEAQFSVETDVEKPLYVWSDKYRPRKPRYFNRVHTGFEWNKYNQTHYDLDNPPPKVVQGYKFNIFYPDLIDKSATPKYTITPCKDNSDFAVLRISVGPPYEDIAFKIVNREWEYSYKRGFRCQFHNNIFQLWFHFKRYRYRR